MIPAFPTTVSPRRAPRRKTDRALNQVAGAVRRELDVNPVSMAIDTVATIPVDVTPVQVAAITPRMQEIRLEDLTYEIIFYPVVSHSAEVVSSVVPHSAEVVSSVVPHSAEVVSSVVSPRAEDYQPSAPPLHALPHPTAHECLRRLDALELEIAWMCELMSRLH